MKNKTKLKSFPAYRSHEQSEGESGPLGPIPEDWEDERTIKTLMDFNKHAQEIFELSFVKKAEKSGVRIKWDKNEGGHIEYYGPDDEAIKAFSNDIRKFFQQNDTLSIYKLQPLYNSSHIEKSENKLYGEIIGGLKEFDEKTTTHINNGINITNKDIFETYLYGKVSHRSAKTKEKYDQWEKSPIWYFTTKLDYVRILYIYMRFISNVVYVNNQILIRLKRNNESKGNRLG